MIESGTAASIPTALELRQHGNDLVKAGDFSGAVNCYTRALAKDCSDTKLFTNRAYARLQLRQFSEAADDCSSALELDKRCVKALFRRGQARRSLGMLELATSDFHAAHKLAPSRETEKAWKNSRAAMRQSVPEATLGPPLNVHGQEPEVSSISEESLVASLVETPWSPTVVHGVRCAAERDATGIAALVVLGVVTSVSLRVLARLNEDGTLTPSSNIEVAEAELAASFDLLRAVERVAQRRLKSVPVPGLLRGKADGAETALRRAVAAISVSAVDLQRNVRVRRIRGAALLAATRLLQRVSLKEANRSMLHSSHLLDAALLRFQRAFDPQLLVAAMAVVHAHSLDQREELTLRDAAPTLVPELITLASVPSPDEREPPDVHPDLVSELGSKCAATLSNLSTVAGCRANILSMHEPTTHLLRSIHHGAGWLAVFSGTGIHPPVEFVHRLGNICGTIMNCTLEHAPRAAIVALPWAEGLGIVVELLCSIATAKVPSRTTTSLASLEERALATIAHIVADDAATTALGAHPNATDALASAAERCVRETVDGREKDGRLKYAFQALAVLAMRDREVAAKLGKGPAVRAAVKYVSRLVSASVFDDFALGNALLLFAECAKHECTRTAVLDGYSNDERVTDVRRELVSSIVKMVKEGVRRCGVIDQDLMLQNAVFALTILSKDPKAKGLIEADGVLKLMYELNVRRSQR